VLFKPRDCVVVSRVTSKLPQNKVGACTQAVKLPVWLLKRVQLLMHAHTHIILCELHHVSCEVVWRSGLEGLLWLLCSC
jgi:hypothetical protein